MPQLKPRLHAIMVTYRRRDAAAATVAALLAQTRPPDTITIVDNDADPLVESIARRLGVRYVAQPDNGGPAGAIAAGVADLACWAEPHDLVLSMDDDDPPAHSAILDQLVTSWDAARTEGFRPGGIGGAGGRYRRWTGTTERPADDELSGWIPVDALGGGSQPIYLLEALVATGATRPDLFFGYEELELGLRLRALGYDLLVPGDVLRESRSRLDRLGISGRQVNSIRVRAPWRCYYSSRNLTWIARSHGHPSAPIVTTLRLVTAAARDAVVRHDLRSAALTLRGLLDGWRGRLGRTIDPG